MGDHYRELVDRKEVIVETLKNEESLFRRTLDSGDEMLSGHLEDWKTGVNPKTLPLPGELAFKLYDTYGFPLEVTQELCDEIGVKVDMDGYRAAMAEAQERSRGASGMDTVYGGVAGGLVFLDDKGQEAKLQPTEFLGYEASWADAQVLAVAKTDDTHAAVVLDRTPFYAESGGQMADHGTIKGEGFELKVTHVTKQDDAFIHAGELTGTTPKGKVQAVVDQNRRNAIVRNHTATHLLHAALRQTLGKHVTQAGSLVAPDYLRFDFTHGAAMSPEEIAKVEKLVNEQVLTAARVKVYQDVAIDEARDMGAMALFGEKYADKVRVVQIGDMQPDESAFSRELCGGTHVRNVGEIGLFKILHEASAASGVRRIEAVTGLGAYEWVLEQVDSMKQAAGLLKANPKDLVQAVEKNLDALKEERKKREKLAAQGGGAQTQAESIGSVELAVEKMDGADPKDAQLVADRLVEGKPNRVGLVATVSEGKVAFVCKVGDAAKAAGAHAGNIVREAAKITGGGGGGRPDFATAGGKDPNKLDEAIVAAREVLATQLGL
jgi:alanyl-tRNA synthetase